MELSADTFGEWVKRRRAALDLTQVALAEAVGCSAITIQKLEAGRRRPSLQILERLADALDVRGLERAAFLRAGRAQRREGIPAALDPHHAPRLRAASPPLPLTPLVGRDHDLAALRARLADPAARLITITGPAGVGKTRLALEAASRADSGAAFIPLASVTDPAAVAPAIAHALGEALPAGPPHEAIAALLRGRRELLVLDNFEQIVEAAPELAAALQATPELRVLVTSRERLHVRGEQVLPLAPLRLPIPGDLPLDELAAVPAVALFCQVSRAARPDFALTPANAAAVAQLCARLDGLPLAIEIVAASADLPPADMLERLDAQRSLTMLGPRDLPARQRSLWAAFDWSYARLAPESQRAFARLGVFAAGWDVAAAAAVDPAAPAQLDTLVQATLVQRLAGDGQARYALLETVREFALERLGDDHEEARTRHAEHYLAVAEAGARELRGAGQAEWVARLRRDQPNMQAALGWLLASGRWELAARLAVGLQRFWWMQGQLSESRRLIGRVLDQPDAIPGALLGQLWHALGTAEAAQGDQRQAERSLRQGMAVSRASGDSYTLGLCAHALGLALVDAGDYESARELLELGLEIDVELEDRRGQAISLGSLGGLAYHQGDFARARRLFEESLALHRAVADVHSVALTLNNLAEIARRDEDDAAALAFLDEAIAISRAIDGRRLVPYMLNNRAALLARREQPEAARAALAEAIGLLREIGDRGELVTALVVGARLRLGGGAAGVAALLIGAVDQLVDAGDLSVSPVTQGDVEALAGRVAAQLGEVELAQLRRAGRQLSLDAALDMAARA